MNNLHNLDEYIKEIHVNVRPEEKVNYVCPECGGDNLLYDAFATWDVDAQELVLHSTYETVRCEDCDKEVTQKEIIV